MLITLLKTLVSNFRHCVNNGYLEWKYRSLHLKVGSRCKIRESSFQQYNTIYDNVFLSRVKLGKFSYISNNARINNTTIGSFCSIGPGCSMGLGKHPTSKFVSTHPAFYSVAMQTGATFVKENYFDEYESIEIGHDVWIGANAIIMDGVHIGSGAIVGAGAVVVDHVPEYSIVGGIPAKILRYRFEPEEIDILLGHPWWDKDLGWIRNNIDNMQDIKRYVMKDEV